MKSSRIAVFVLTLMAANSTLAGSVSGYIQEVVYRTDINAVLFSFKPGSTVSGLPSCATWIHKYGFLYAPPSTGSEAHKVLFSLLTSAQASGQKVFAAFGSSCVGSSVSSAKVTEIRLGIN